MIKELCEYIEDNTDFTVGTDLFALSEDTDSVDDCIIIAEPSPGLADALLTDTRQVPLVAYARSTDKHTARTNAYAVFDALHGIFQVSLPVVGSGPIYLCNISCSTPYYLGLDESERRAVYAMPFDVHVTNML